MGREVLAGPAERAYRGEMVCPSCQGAVGRRHAGMRREAYCRTCGREWYWDRLGPCWRRLGEVGE